MREKEVAPPAKGYALGSRYISPLESGEAHKTTATAPKPALPLGSIACGAKKGVIN